MPWTQPVRPDRVRPGDFADHKSRELDPRPVHSVDHSARTVRLDINGHVTKPLPRSNYSYYRRVELDGAR